MIQDLKPLIGSLCSYAKQKMNFSRPPRLFLRSDENNSKMALGRTAHYNPQDESVTVFITGRHPKDILRSISHELVHHTQNLRGDLSADKCGNMDANYAQNNQHLRKMEEEAYLTGNMCFRDWEDSLQNKEKILFKLVETKFLKESKKMSTKINKKILKEAIQKLLNKKINEQAMAMVGDSASGISADRAMAEPEGFNAIGAAVDAVSDPALKKALEVIADALVNIEQGRGPFEAAGGLEEAAGPKPDFADLDGDGDEEEPMKDAAADADDKGEKKQKKPESKEEEEEVNEEQERNTAMTGTRSQLKELIAVLRKSGSRAMRKKAEEIARKQTAKRPGVTDEDTIKSFTHMLVKRAKEEYPEMYEDALTARRGGSNKSSVADSEGGADDVKETKIQTPEQENKLYESRFSNRDNNLFNRLIKEWTK